MQPSKIRIALIGLGDIAEKAYLPIVVNHPKVSPILCTRNKETLDKLAYKYRINEIYSSIDELIKSEPEAAMVHSATKSHYNIVSKLIDAGIPVFVDKPLCYTLHETEKLLSNASEKKVSIYLGFNRRFAPLIHSLKEQQNPIQIIWQKNRVNLPGDPRMFVFDDFIHIVDSLRFLAEGSIENLQVFPRMRNNQLGALQVQWEQNGTLLTGIMNRVSGITEERVEYYSAGNKWKIEELTSGIHYQGEKQNIVEFGNWDHTLYKRGFVNLFEDWLSVLQQNTFETDRIQDIWGTHNLCEKIVTKIINT